MPAEMLGLLHASAVEQQVSQQVSCSLHLPPLPRLRDFYIHSVGHYLGLDVHDTHTVGQMRQLAPGMIIALEPGLYVPDLPRYGPFSGIGIRIGEWPMHAELALLFCNAAWQSSVLH